MKNINENIENVQEESIRLIGIFLIVILITFLTVILVYYISLYKYNKSAGEDDVNKFEIKRVVVDSEYESITLDDTKDLHELCLEDCKFKTNIDNQDIYYHIRKVDDSYSLDINQLYIHINTINIGETIDNLSISKYKDMDMIKTIYHDTSTSYDEVIFINGKKVDVITSVSANEVEITDEGIIYYSYSCFKNDNSNGIKFKNIKKPFENNNTVISYENVNVNYC